MRTLIVLLLVATALAGCSDSAAPIDDDLIPDDVVADDKSGAISGVVVDATIRPVEGVLVAVQGGTMETITDVDGRFIFEKVVPGVYFLDFSHQDYDGVQTSVEVSAGVVSKPKVVINFNPQPLPYFATQQFDGWADAWVGIGGWAYDITVGSMTGVRACAACEFEYFPGGVPETIVLNPQWDHSIDPGPYHGTETYGYYLGLDWPEDFERWYVDSGDSVHAQKSMYGENTDFEVSMYPDDVWPGIQQGYQLFVTAWFVEAAPESWSFFDQ